MTPSCCEPTADRIVKNVAEAEMCSYLLVNFIVPCIPWSDGASSLYYLGLLWRPHPKSGSGSAVTRNATLFLKNIEARVTRMSSTPPGIIAA